MELSEQLKSSQHAIESGALVSVSFKIVVLSVPNGVVIAGLAGFDVSIFSAQVVLVFEAERFADCKAVLAELFAMYVAFEV